MELFRFMTITVDCPHNYIANVSTRMAARQRSESQLFWMQLPVGAHTMDKMSRDGQVRVTDLWCPGIVGEQHLTRDILASEWIFILVQQAIGLTLSSSFSRASLRLALLIIYFIAESLVVRNVLVWERRSKVCEYATKWTLSNKLKSLNNII